MWPDASGDVPTAPTAAATAAAARAGGSRTNRGSGNATHSCCAAPTFYQQQLPSVPSVLPPCWCAAVLAILGAAFVAVGSALLVADSRLAEYAIQYDGPGTSAPLAVCAVNVSRGAGETVRVWLRVVFAALCRQGCASLSTAQSPRSSPPQGPCNVPVLITDNMKAPIFVSVKLGSFYQNHRSYVKSRSDTQMSGVVFDSEAKLEECEPLIGRGEQILHPCGLIANSFFNGGRDLICGTARADVTTSRTLCSPCRHIVPDCISHVT